jgi:hypothetical protein
MKKNILLDYIIVENNSRLSLQDEVLNFSKQGYILHGDLIVLISSGSEIYYQSMILVNDTSLKDGSIYVPSVPDDEIFNPYDKGGF